MKKLLFLLRKKKGKAGHRFITPLGSSVTIWWSKIQDNKLPIEYSISSRGYIIAGNVDVEIGKVECVEILDFDSVAFSLIPKYYYLNCFGVSCKKSKGD